MSSDPRAVPRLLLALVLLVVPAWCLFEALELVLHLFGESPTRAEQQAAARWTGAAVVVGLGGSVAGLVLSTGRRLATAGFTAALLLSLGLGLAAAATAPRAPAPEAPPGPRPCQEHSGGPAECPGG